MRRPDRIIIEHCSSNYMVPYIYDSILVYELLLPIYISLVEGLFNSLDLRVIINGMTLANILIFIIVIMAGVYVHP